MEKAKDRSELTNQVIDIIIDSLNLKHIDKSQINDETPFINGGLNLDSVDILEIIVQIEHNFGIKMNDAEAYQKHFKNIGSLVDFVFNFESI